MWVCKWPRTRRRTGLPFFEDPYVRVCNKATSTLEPRVSPVARYCKFMFEKGITPFSLDESNLYLFMTEYGVKAAAAFPSSLLSSLVIMQRAIGVKGADGAVSVRVRGVSKSHYLTKAKRQQKPPLLVQHVRLLELIVVDGKAGDGKFAEHDRYAAGVFLWIVYSRGRFLDGQNSGSIKLDITTTDDGPVGYLEASVERSKTSHTLERKVMFLPMIAPIYGFAAQPWGIVWYGLAQEHGPPLAPDEPLLPAWGIFP